MTVDIIAIHDGPCGEYAHAGQPCRIHWFTCSCFTGSRLESPPMRHDVADPRALEWAYETARAHLRDHHALPNERPTR